MTDHYALHRRALESIGQGYLDPLKRPERFVKGVWPTHLVKGRGAWVWDHRGKKYLDFLSPSVLGHAPDRVASAVAESLTSGFSLPLASHHEMAAAEKLKELFPFCDAFRFYKTHREAYGAAWMIADGVPGGGGGTDLTRGECAFGPSEAKWMQQAEQQAKANGLVTIFDETLSALRFPKFSLSSHVGITPDVVIVGGSLASGMPLYAVGGKYAVMNGDYDAASPEGGDIPSLVAAKTTMELLQTRYELPWLWRKGEAVMEELNSYWPEGVQVEGYATRGRLKGKPLAVALFMQEAATAGILIGPEVVLSFPLLEEWENVRSTLKAILWRIKNGEVVLQGEAPG